MIAVASFLGGLVALLVAGNLVVRSASAIGERFGTGASAHDRTDAPSERLERSHPAITEGSGAGRRG